MISSVSVRDWKRFRRHSLDLRPGMNVLVGLNGSGKTSLMEAIRLALSGDVSVGRPENLVHYSAQDAEVCLRLSVGESTYQVVRVVTRRGTNKARLLDSADRQLATGWDQVTTAVYDLLGCAATLFPHLVYLSEGYAQSMATKPPAPNVLRAEMDRVLGIDTLGLLSRTARKCAAEFDRRADELKKWRSEVLALPSLPQTRLAQLGEQLAVVEQEETKLAAQIAELAAAERESVRRRTALVAFAAELTAVGRRISMEAEPPGLHDVVPTLTRKIVECRSGLPEVEKDVTEARARAARLAARVEQVVKTLDLLSPADTAVATVQCPVCATELSVDRVTAIRERLHRELQSLQKESADAQVECARLEESRQELVNALASYDKDLARLDALRQQLGAETEIADLEDEIARLAADIEGAAASRRSAEEAARVARERMRPASRALAEAESGMRQRQEATLAIARITALTKGAFLCQALQHAVGKAIAHQRTEKLDDVLEDLTLVWNSFWTYPGARVGLDTRAMPVITTEHHQFDFASLSGGERVALLVALRVLLAQRLTQTRFLILDEPLEHLDLVNRRSLLRFLQTACQRGFVEQLIICTFEERLTRPYLQGEEVHRVAVPALAGDLTA